MLTATAAVAIGHLRMKLALLVRGLAGTGEARAFDRLAADVVLLSAFAVTATATATAAPSAPTSTPATAFATRAILRRAIARIDVRWCLDRARRALRAGCRDCIG